MIYFQLKVYEIETALPKFPALCPWLCLHATLINAISYGNRKKLRISIKIPLFFFTIKTLRSSVPVNSSVTGLEWPNNVCVDFTMLILDKQLLLVTAEKNMTISNHTCM